MCICIVSLAESSPVGRLDRQSLSQQTLMELFVEHVTNREKVCRSQEDVLDIKRWNKVVVNRNGEVTKIHFDGLGLQGSLSFQWIPQTVGYFTCWSNSLIGTLDLGDLSSSMTYISVTGNQMSGTLSLADLPSRIESVFLNQNRFSGTVNLTILPGTLISLTVANNQMSGRVNVTNLPDKLEFLNLYDNRFEGETDFSRIPDSLKSFYLGNNPKLSGSVDPKYRGVFSCGNTGIIFK